MGLKRDELYLLKSINMDYVNLDKSYIDSDGAVRFNLNMDKLPNKDGKTAREIFNNTLFDSVYNLAYCHGRSLQKKCEPDNTTEYDILYFPNLFECESCDDDNDKKSPTSGFLNTELFHVRHGLERHINYDFVVGQKMRSLKLLNSNLYDKITSLLEEFNKKAHQWVLELIRDTLFEGEEVIGDFVNDNITGDTYTQVRQQDGKYIFYIVGKWWQFMWDEPLIWEEMSNGENTIFGALQHSWSWTD